MSISETQESQSLTSSLWLEMSELMSDHVFRNRDKQGSHPSPTRAQPCLASETQQNRCQSQVHTLLQSANKLNY